MTSSRKSIVSEEHGGAVSELRENGGGRSGKVCRDAEKETEKRKAAEKALEARERFAAADREYARGRPQKTSENTPASSALRRHNSRL